MSAGGFHTCAIRATDQTLRCWGEDHTNRYPFTGANRSPLYSNLPTGRFKALAQSAGLAHDCALRQNDRLACWGFRSKRISDIPDNTFTEVATGLLTSCGIKTDQSIACWGSLDNTPANIPGPYHSLSIAHQVCALDQNNAITCLGSPSALINNIPAGQYQGLAVGGNHACAISRADTTADCWGSLIALPPKISSGTQVNTTAEYTVPIIMVTTPTIAISTKQLTLIEGGPAKELTITANPPLIEDISVTLGNSNRSRIQTIPSTTMPIDIPSGSTQHTLMVSAINNSNANGAQTYTLSLTAIRSGLAQIDNDNSQATITVLDDDSDVLIASLNTNRVNEGGMITLNLRRSANTLTGALNVTLSAKTADGRITLPTNPITLPNGQQSLATRINIRTDNFANPQSTYTFTIQVPPARQRDYLITTANARAQNRATRLQRRSKLYHCSKRPS